MNCLICKVREADFKGSHIIPHFIIAPGISDGSTTRDIEQSFRIDGTGSDFSFGRSVLPEALEDTLGRPVTDEEIENNEHHYVRDDIYCTQTEVQLSKFESLYNNQVSPPLLNAVTLSDDLKRVAHFFWLSIILRCSVVEFNGFKLAPDLEQEVSDEVNAVLAESESEIRQKCLAQPLTRNIFIGYTGEPEDFTRNFTLLHPNKKSPYLLIINNYVIIYDYSNNNQLTDILNEMGATTPVAYVTGTIIHHFSESDRNSIIRYCAAIGADQFIVTTKASFEEAFFHNRQSMPTPQQISDFFTELLHHDDSLLPTVRYDASRVKELIQKHSQPA
ncbi:hypothetical protein [Hymenobacter convexus]|uniref:hypothetical protein n=1 Tax=Hymenobacter sp. CA1UV-4 TaxID=3063782 RepID=UPI0027128770|nr:hypothetical protein [Hymenobacter sp. CA1UV-4]MDO7853422.1 hypothetical protein [Hymenobacter sp. CA1UV-4]